MAAATAEDRLFSAAGNGNLKNVINLIKGVKNINLDARHQGHWTALHFAVQNGHNQIVNCLIKNGADVNVEGKNKCTPLHMAIENSHINVVDSLIQTGRADTEAKNAAELTP